MASKRSRPWPAHPINKTSMWKNKDETSDSYKKLPHPGEDVVKSVKKDLSTIERGKTPSATPFGQEMRDASTSRAKSRMAGRAGMVGAALGAGYDLGTKINQKYDVSGKIADALPPSAAEKAVSRRDVEMENFRAGPKMYDDDGRRLRDINGHKWKGSM